MSAGHVLLAAWQQSYPHMAAMGPYHAGRFGGGFGGGLGGIVIRALVFGILFRVFRLLTLPQLVLLLLVAVVLVMLWRRGRYRRW